jgi:hypothetical protein
MKTVVFVVALVFVASACTSKTIPASATGTATSEEPAPRPSPTTTLSHAGLELGPRTSTAGWVVMADGFGVHVAGGGTLQNIDPVTGKSSSVVKVGSWDYDFIRLGRDGEGSLWLTSGHNLWFIAGSPHYAVGRQYNLHRLGYVGAVYQASPRAGGGLWLAASGNKQQSGLLAEIDPDSGSIIRRFDPPGGSATITEAAGFLVAQTGSGVIRINPRTGGQRTKRFVVAPAGLATTGDRIWWSSPGGAVTCLLVETFTHCGSVDIPQATSLSSDGYRLWVLSGGPSKPAAVTLMNGKTGDVLGGPLELPHLAPASITSYDGHAWIGSHDAQVVIRIDRDPS